MISILRKGFLLLLLLFLLFLLGTLTLGGNRIFSHTLEKYGPAAFQQPIRFQSAQLSVLGGRAGVEQFHVGTEENPLLDIGNAGINLGILALLEGRIHIEKAQLNATRLHLLILEDGTLSLDSGPPPQAVADANPMPQSKASLPPAQKRDLVQIATEYWNRYQHYKEYYDKVDLAGNSENPTSVEAKLARIKHPGVPAYVQTAKELADGSSSGGRFWLEQAQIDDFTWETHDLRTQKPVLPALKNFGLSLQNIGTPPSGLTPPAIYAGKGELAAGGSLDIRLSLSRDDTPSALDFSAEALPVASIAGLFQRSFPFRIAGGSLDFKTTDIQFQQQQLHGAVRVVLHNTKLKPKPHSPQVLGIDPAEFCNLLNSALKTQAIAFVIRLSGTPTAPNFALENETDLGNLLGGAVQAEVERRAKGLVEEHLGDLQNKADELLQDKLPRGLFGGKKN